MIPLRFALPVFALACLSCAKDPAPATVAAAVQPASPTVQRPPYLDISIRSQGQRVPVIMYHDIIEKRDRHAQWFDCTAEEFSEQMLWLREQNITPISLQQLYKHLTAGEAIPDRAVVLTFDDNYQGFYDRALPVLRQFNYPAAVFVHTGFVGNKEGLHPKMDWQTLKELAGDPLVTIGSHTVSHPDDMTKLTPDEQLRELRESKEALEKQLGRSVPFLAYPNGKNDATVQDLARSVGYTMAFSIDNGLAEESPNIWCVNRYVHTRLEKAWDDCERAVRGGAFTFYGPLKKASVSYEEFESDRVRLGLIKGGTPVSVMSPYGREAVGEMIKRVPSAVAGINGGYFAMAAVASTDNRMVGPLKTRDMVSVVADEARERWGKLRNRPVVVWGPSSFAIVPYQPETMRTDEAFRDLMPDMTDTFLTGVWLVRDGIPRSGDDMNVFAASDIQDTRKRAFLGIMPDGTIVLGASLNVCSSERLARAAAAAGLWQAVLLDSGFSTSLVYGESIKAYGHSSPKSPSRPVPHAVVLVGDLDPATAALAKPEPEAQQVESPTGRTRR